MGLCTFTLRDGPSSHRAVRAQLRRPPWRPARIPPACDAVGSAPPCTPPRSRSRRFGFITRQLGGSRCRRLGSTVHPTPFPIPPVRLHHTAARRFATLPQSFPFLPKTTRPLHAARMQGTWGSFRRWPVDRQWISHPSTWSPTQGRPLSPARPRSRDARRGHESATMRQDDAPWTSR